MVRHALLAVAGLKIDLGEVILEPCFLFACRPCELLPATFTCEISVDKPKAGADAVILFLGVTSDRCLVIDVDRAPEEALRHLARVGVTEDVHGLYFLAAPPCSAFLFLISGVLKSAV